jgi:hypothetical protein
VNNSASNSNETGDSAKGKSHFPFFQHHAPTQGSAVNTTRLIEAIIIAALSSLCTSITMVPRLEERINAQGKEIQELREQVSAMRHDFYVPFGRQQSGAKVP